VVRRAGAVRAEESHLYFPDAVGRINTAQPPVVMPTTASARRANDFGAEQDERA
jgi:hypothetical protein